MGKNMNVVPGIGILEILDESERIVLATLKESIMLALQENASKWVQTSYNEGKDDM